MTETTDIKRSHEWVPPKRGERTMTPRCRICGALKRPGRLTWCYVEAVEPEDG